MKINDIISAAAEELGISFENNALWFEVLIYQALRSHKTPNLYVPKKVLIEVLDNKLTLPSDLLRLECVTTKCETSLYCENIHYCLQGDTLVFMKSEGIADGTQIQISYMGLNTDEDGYIIIPDSWERMLVAYIGWKYTRRYPKEYPAYVMQSFQREFQTQKLANT